MVQLGDEGDYDYIIIGFGGVVFLFVIEVVKYGVKVVIIECGMVGGICVNIGCVFLKILLWVGEINYLVKNNLFIGLYMLVGDVDLVLLIKQKNELVMDF